MGRHIDFDLCAILRFACYGSLREGYSGRAAYPPNWANEIYQRGEIVRAHVKHRAAADFVVELRSRMPAFMAVAHHECGGCDRLSDETVNYNLSAGLYTTPQEGIRRASYPALRFVSLLKEASSHPPW